MMAPLFGLPPEELDDLPARVHRHVDEIGESLEARRERWDASYFVFQGDDAWSRWLRSSPSSAAPESTMAEPTPIDLAFAGCRVDRGGPRLRRRPRPRACGSAASRHVTRSGPRRPPSGSAPSRAPTTSCPPARPAWWCARRPRSTSTHALHAIAGGAGVLIEKPLCTTLGRGGRAGRRRRARRSRSPTPRTSSTPRSCAWPLGARRPAARHRPRRGAGAAVATRPGATSSPRAGAAACCSTSASTRSPSRCCSPRRPCPWRCAPRSREPPTTRSTSTPRCSCTSTRASWLE